MPLDDKLLEVLCCPKTKVPVKLVSEEKLKKLNELIKGGGVRFVGGEAVEDSLEEALITEDGKTVYMIQTGIPIMLEDKGISTEQLKEF